MKEGGFTYNHFSLFLSRIFQIYSRVEASHQATATPTKETLDPKREWRTDYSLPHPGYQSPKKPPISAKKATTIKSLKPEVRLGQQMK
ncbi:hypothetical protein KFK09_023224 [Dendrobium nobile]|uniref:Uncharacterized protein n=1 Tax=Dendrobium nobile TaxID=94219 RepID=A0A8T3ALK2_DENNO|nr:hypothetical protein KFK09_023224 [Dendrobium nobile]